MKYISYYDTLDNKEENRSYTLAATNKMDYIIGALNRVGESVEIVSASGTLGKKACRGRLKDLGNGNSLKLFYSLGRGNKIKNVVGRVILKAAMFFYLLKKIKKNETVIAYHSLAYMGMLRFLKRLKKFYLILELEEIYADVAENEKTKKKELAFANIADAYCFPTETLNEIINKENKPYVVVHGTYKTEALRASAFDDGKIHVVYAGTFDPRKGGVAAAIGAAEFLDERYHLHVIGFGNEKEIESVKKSVESVNRQGKCSASYDGLLKGENYIAFLQKCHIGLSTQNPNGKFNATSFPSKILSYMANGLRVVSVRIPVIEASKVHGMMYYYDEPTPENIAKAIMQVDIRDGYDSRKRIDELDEEFRMELLGLLGGNA